MNTLVCRTTGFLVITGCVSVALVADVRAGTTCQSSGGVWICLERSGPPPVLNTDFSLDGQNVTLITEGSGTG